MLFLLYYCFFNFNSPNRQIGMSEVRNVIDELCYSTTPNNSNNKIQKSSKTDIERLLLSLKNETNELSELRSQTKFQSRNNEINEKSEKNEKKVVDRNVGVSYSNRLKEYYEKRKFDEEKEKEERMMM